MDNPTLYSRHAGEVFNKAAVMLDELWPNLTWQDTSLPALDIGCGSGDVDRKVIAPRLPPGMKLIATDLNPRMVEFAKEHNTLPGVIAYDVYDGAAEDVFKTRAWAYAPFGKIFSIYTLHWIPDNRRAIENMYKLLAPGGEVVLILMAASPFLAHDTLGKGSMWGKYMKGSHQFLSPYHYSEDPATEFRQLLLDAGFEVVWLHSDKRCFSFNTKEDCKGVLTSVNPFLHRVPEDQKEAFMNAVWDANLQQKSITIDHDPVTSQTKFSYNFPCILSVARKP